MDLMFYSLTLCRVASNPDQNHLSELLNDKSGKRGQVCPNKNDPCK